ncbi:MAG: ATP-dependent DNA ligase [Nanoarchaeota archaeon]|nr:ATP-dependent DNA ligase [Nanoarchaeota archaeon]
MRYLKLAELYRDSSATTKRLEKIEILSKFLISLSQKDRDVMYLLLGDIYPEYDERRIGISNQIAIKAISKATGIEIKEVNKKWKSIGDIGLVAENLTKNKKQITLATNILTIEKVLENLRKLPKLEGKGTVGKKLSLITELLTSATPLEALYLVRTLIGDLRIGIKESTIKHSLAKAFFKKDENAAIKIQEAIDKSNDIAAVFDIAKKKKIKDFEKIHLQVGKPIKAMLAQKVKTFEEGFKALGKPCAIEYKYDGFRMIIHKNNEDVTLFTRSLENVTKQFPEVVEYIKKYVKGKSFILDSEAVGFNKKTKKYTAFQDISQRIRRKYNIKDLQDKLPVEVNVFDILYYEGKSMLNETFKERTKIVKKIIKKHPYKIIYSKQIITGDEKKAREFYKQALKDNQEGIMMKNLDAIYQPGRRVGHMMKIKPEVKDLDLVIVGGEYGTGKRSGWISSYNLACVNKKGEYLEIGKMGTGMKEKADQGMTFEQLTEEVKPYIIKEKGKKVFIKPKIVISVTYQEIQKSPNYPSGFALRFPRFISLRPDRRAEEITTVEEIADDFDHQKRNWKYG